jgi:hypothetical protein
MHIIKQLNKVNSIPWIVHALVYFAVSYTCFNFVFPSLFPKSRSFNSLHSQGRIQDFSYVSQSFRMYNLVLRTANARGT